MGLPNSAGAAGKLARLGEGKLLMVLGMPHFVRLQSDQNVTGASVMEVVVAPGQGVPPHTHTREDEIFCVVQGELTCQMEGSAAPVTLRTGDSVFLPRNRSHGFTNTSAKEARMLVTVTPGTGTDRMFAELDAACRKYADPKQLMPELGRIGETYGIRFAHSSAPQQPVELSVGPSDQTIHLGPVEVRFLITSENAGGSVAIFEVLVPGKNRLAGPAHSHDHYEESIYGLDGVLTWTVDGKQIDIGPGQALCIERGAIHRFDNNGSRDARVLCIVTPAEIGPRYFREIAEVLSVAGNGAPDRPKIAEIMRRHGLTPAPPPSGA